MRTARVFFADLAVAGEIAGIVDHDHRRRQQTEHIGGNESSPAAIPAAIPAEMQGFAGKSSPSPPPPRKQPDKQLPGSAVGNRARPARYRPAGRHGKQPDQQDRPAGMPDQIRAHQHRAPKHSATPRFTWRAVSQPKPWRAVAPGAPACPRRARDLSHRCRGWCRSGSALPPAPRPGRATTETYGF